MTTVRFWRVECDLELSPDCASAVGTEDTMKEARALAEKIGWHKAGVDGVNRDICPNCYTYAFEARGRD